MKLAVILCLLCTALCGCVETVFESQPGDQVRACDERFVGKWQLISIEMNARSDDKLFVVVDAGCKVLHFLENGKDDTDTDAKTHLAFGSVGAKSVLSVKIDNNEQATEKTRWSNGYHYFLYDIRRHEIRLRPVHDLKVAHWIIDDKIQGRTETISREPRGRPSSRLEHGRMVHNYVAGDAEAMARTLELRGIFVDEPTFILKPATDAEISAAAKPAPASK